MNDNELGAMVRESVADVRSSTPVEQIISRGHAVRARRRRVPAAVGALAVAGGAALGVTALAPSGHLAPAAAGKAGNHPAVVRLAAWTVTRHPNGDIDVTLRQLQHPLLLEYTLRADGLPAHVSFSGHPGRAVCQPYSASRFTNTGILYRFATWRLTAGGGDLLMTLHPSVLPSGAGVSFSVGNLSGLPFGLKIGLLKMSLVDASQQCTG